MIVVKYILMIVLVGCLTLVGSHYGGIIFKSQMGQFLGGIVVFGIIVSYFISKYVESDIEEEYPPVMDEDDW
jgi:hypothetical protein